MRVSSRSQLQKWFPIARSLELSLCLTPPGSPITAMMLSGTTGDVQGLFQQFSNWTGPGRANGTDSITMLVKDLRAVCSTWLRMNFNQCDAKMDPGDSDRPDAPYNATATNDDEYCVYDYRNLPYLDTQCNRTCQVDVAVTNVSLVGLTSMQSCASYAQKVRKQQTFSSAPHSYTSRKG